MKIIACVVVLRNEKSRCRVCGSEDFQKPELFRLTSLRVDTLAHCTVPLPCGSYREAGEHLRFIARRNGNAIYSQLPATMMHSLNVPTRARRWQNYERA
jgi:hypothetical protein